ncbi:hypothetical protein D3C71_1195080 [compost metagenome]
MARIGSDSSTVACSPDLCGIGSILHAMGCGPRTGHRRSRSPCCSWDRIRPCFAASGLDQLVAWMVSGSFVIPLGTAVVRQRLRPFIETSPGLFRKASFG